MKILHRQGDADLAQVFVAKFRDDERYMAEFVSAKDVNLPLTEKWVIIISTQFGCPVKCPICDAGSEFHGNLTADEMLKQIDFIVQNSTTKPEKCKKFKIQFARMGEPALNPAVLEVLKKLPTLYDTKNLIPCISTIAPKASNNWFEKLLEIKREYYSDEFQLQFSVHSTSDVERDYLMPTPKWNLKEISEYGTKFISGDKRKASLNFALTKDSKMDSEILCNTFSPKKFCIKITPVNPTSNSQINCMTSEMNDVISDRVEKISRKLISNGFDVIVSIGDLRENEIGSNCGMAVRKLILS
ncbi:MAG: radical SAM protein [Pseudomonadota bacterium]